MQLSLVIGNLTWLRLSPLPPEYFSPHEEVPSLFDHWSFGVEYFLGTLVFILGESALHLAGVKYVLVSS